MLGVQRSCGFDDGRRWLVRRLRPCDRIDRHTSNPPDAIIEQLPQARGVRQRRREDVVDKGLSETCLRMGSLCRDEDWDNRRVMAGAMEVFQVEGIVPNLISMLAGVVG